MKTFKLLPLLALVVAPAAANGQGLDQRVFGAGDGTVRFNFPTRPEVEICDQGVRIGEDRMMWRSRGWDEEEENCRFGPAEVELEIRGGALRDVDLIRRERDRTRGATDLGAVPAQTAVDFFLAQARSGGRSGRGEEEAIFPVILADVEEVWVELLDVARDRTVDEEARSSALFWVGQEAATAVTEGLAEVALDDDEDQDVREAAIFALSQRSPDEGVPILMEIARTAAQADTRETAMFWLAQSEDERVYDFFEEILLGRRGGG
jgi:hypothetical protein